MADVIAVPDPQLAEQIIAAIEANCQPEPRVRDRLSASQGHRCERALLLELEAPKPPKLPIQALTAFAIGHAVHDLAQRAFPNAPFEEEWQSDFVTGHSDQRFRTPAGDLLVDYKTCHADAFLKVALDGPKPEHVSQATWYAWMAGAPVAAVVYFNKNGRLTDHQRRLRLLTIQSELVCAWRFRVDPALAQEYEDKGRRILEHRAAETVAPLENVPECRICNWTKPCARLLKQETRRA